MQVLPSLALRGAAGTGFRAPSLQQSYFSSTATNFLVLNGVNTPVDVRTFPAGSYVVRTAQLQGRVLVHLLEPETTDGVVYWNRMDAWIPRPRSAGATTDPDEEDAPPPRPASCSHAG